MATFTRALRAWRPTLSRATPWSNAVPRIAGVCVPSSRWKATTATATAPLVAQHRPSEDAESPAEALDTDDEKATAAATGTPFKSLKGAISYDLLKAITEKPFKFEHMTSVQEAVLPLLPGIAEPYDKDKERASVRDLLVRAKTGTGKTLAFLVPAIEARLKAIEAYTKQAAVDATGSNDRNVTGRLRRDYTHNRVGVLIISPTRELATQIATEASKLSYHLDGFEVCLFTGGVSKGKQMREWNRGRKDIVVTTPGRMRDLLENEPGFDGPLKYTQTLILDEADTLLDMGFRDDIDYIASQLPQKPERQTFLFSATIDKRVEQVAFSMLNKNHKYVNTVSEDSSPVHAHVPQYHTVLPSAAEQLPHAMRLLALDQLTNAGHSKVIVFCNTTKMTQLFTTILREIAPAVFPAGRQTNIFEIHSKKDQNARTNTSARFRSDKSGASILVTSDVSARGVDYPGVTRVIQIGIPASFEQYIHRVGRTGRTGGFVGRGDLVLLPWEVGFPTYNLAQVPLKPVTANELKKQLMDVAKKFDENPPETPKSQPSIPLRGRGRRDEREPVRIRTPVTPRLEAMDNEIEQLQSSIDEEAVRETFSSMLGFYSSRDRELRCSRNAILDGCKAWAVEACGLPEPPHISEAFLARIGFSKESRQKPARSRFGLNRNKPNRWDDDDEGPRQFRGRGYGRRDNDEDSRRGSKGFDFRDRKSSDRYSNDRYSNDRKSNDRRSSSDRGSRRSSDSGFGFQR
ncbi:DEAD-domain-containing protein [Schizopora paradoxa]|uniref:ATP-dependent RNA helicase n=1 Tax=Schizopora paradoxa TaxID=27342 RepID=A0A0H2RLY6_9AGAM|nr:DEAD-domain-containing protein [Schizopora paradoxa]